MNDLPIDAILGALSDRAQGYLREMAQRACNPEVDRISVAICDAVGNANTFDLLVALVMIVRGVCENAPDDVEASACLDAFIAGVRVGELM